MPNKKARKEFTELEMLARIKVSPTQELHVRIIKMGKKGKPFLDIRQWAISKNYVGYSRKGVQVKKGFIDEVKAAVEKAAELL